MAFPLLGVGGHPAWDHVALTSLGAGRALRTHMVFTLLGVGGNVCVCVCVCETSLP